MDIYMILFLFFCFMILYFIFLILFTCFILRLYFRSLKPKTRTIGFFHPYCNDGGGGERVLWMMVSSIQEKYDDYECIIYSGDNVSPKDILDKVQNRFGIKLDAKRIFFKYLQTRYWLEAKNYPVFTMLGQSLGSILVTLEALGNCTPHIFIDSMGYSFSLWIALLLGGCKIAAYVHYPTISSDMLSRVHSGTQSYNNRGIISKIPLLKYGKVLYYNIFAICYGIAGRASSIVFVNSTWTRNHIDSLWKIPKRTKILYPPCNTSHLSSFPFNNRDRNFISIAQFRPEKDHALQIKSFAELKNKYKDISLDSKLILIGSCRHKQDEDIIENLKKLANELNVIGDVIFRINVSFDELKEWYSKAQFGIHTMWCEHFGIGIVELMSSGVIVVAHNSGGPKLDIIKPYNDQNTGYLASSVEEYAEAMKTMLSLSQSQITKIQNAARQHSQLFSDECFKSEFINEMDILLNSILSYSKSKLE